MLWSVSLNSVTVSCNSALCMNKPSYASTLFLDSDFIGAVIAMEQFYCPITSLLLLLQNIQSFHN